MILDKTQSRRQINWRVMIAALSLSVILVVSLAMLRPAVLAQTASEAASVQLVCVKDVNDHHTGHLWWKPDGQLLSPSKADAGAFQMDQDWSRVTNWPSGTSVNNLVFDFRLPANRDNEKVKLIPTGSMQFVQQKVKQKVGGRSRCMLKSSFPPDLKTTAIKVGIASGPWKECMTFYTLGGGGQTGAYGEHGVETILSSRAISTANGLVWTVTMSDFKDDVRFYVVDKQGHEVLPTIFDDNLSGDPISQITVHFAVPLKQFKEFRIERRPWVWTELKNVALHPVR